MAASGTNGPDGWFNLVKEAIILSALGLCLSKRIQSIRNDQNKSTFTERDPTAAASKTSSSQLQGRGKSHPKLRLTSFEKTIMASVVDPDSIAESLDMIGGLDEIKNELWKLVILPMKRPDIFNNLKSKLISCPKGVLLYGAPGTGKTMLAKAIAKECGASFIDLKSSTIMDKWLGESNKLVNAVFT
jgi:SpoVK/Ycf46/Vps4 family AAA+-type ATPase